MTHTYVVNAPVTIGAVVDAKDLATAGTAVELFDLPAGFVATGLVVEEVETLTATDVTVKADTTVLGAKVTVGDGAKSYSVVDATNKVPLFYPDGVTVTVTPTAAITKGKLRVAVVGFKAMNGEYVSAGDNVAPADTFDARPPAMKS